MQQIPKLAEAGQQNVAPEAPAVVQRRVRVGAADDSFEQEADKMADHVLRQLRTRPDDAVSTSSSPNSRIRRAPASTEASAGAPIGRDGGDVDSNVQARLDASRGRGSALDAPVRRSMEQAFGGADFGKIRIHEDRQSAGLNADLGARAFTFGNDIYMGGGAPSAASAEGQHLLAHELTHTLQQSGSAQRTIRRLAVDKPVGRIRRRTDGATGTDLRRLDSPAVPTVRRLFDSKKKKQAKASKKAAEVEAQVQAQAAKEAESHPSYGALVSAVITVENKLKLLKQDRGMVSTDAGPLLELANSTRRDLPGSEKDPGFGPLKRRLRVAADEAQILLDEVSVASTKRQAERIYLDDGQRGNLKALTNHMKTEEFEDHAGGNVKDAKQESITARRKAADQLGLSRAEAAAITVFTAQDYRYINPATANSRSWMLAMRGDPDKKPNAKNSSQLDDKFVAERTEEGSLHAGMAVQGLMKMPVYQGRTFRGESYNKADFLKKFKIDKKGRVTAKTPTQTRLTISSSTKERENSEQFVFLSVSDLKLPKRSDAYCLIWEYEVTNGRDIEALSANAHEKEVATLPGASFQVVDITPYPNMGSQYLSGLTNVWLVRAKQTK